MRGGGLGGRNFLVIRGRGVRKEKRRKSEFRLWEGEWRKGGNEERRKEGKEGAGVKAC